MTSGVLHPPMPWRPRTRGETLLPSREEVKEEEDEGAPSPRLFRWRRNAVVAFIIIIIITAIYPNTSAIFTNISITFPLYLQQSTLPQPVVPST